RPGLVVELAAAAGPDPALADDRGLGHDVAAHLDRGEDLELGRPDDPREAPLEIPVAPEPERRRVQPREVLGIAHQARRAEAAVRTGLVEAHPVARLVDERRRRHRWNVHGAAPARDPAARSSSCSIATIRVSSWGAV